MTKKTGKLKATWRDKTQATCLEILGDESFCELEELVCGLNVARILYQAGGVAAEGGEGEVAVDDVRN